MVSQKVPDNYWQKRQSAMYYQVVRDLVEGVAKDAQSILDVGSAGCPYLDWFAFIPDRVSIDLHQPYAAPGIRNFTGDFLEWQADKHYDIVTCLQVLEHVPDARAFARKLLAAGKIVVVSVPYKWPKGAVITHVHDPVDEKKMKHWFGRAPNYQYICREVKTGDVRLIQVYEKKNYTWTSLRERGKQSSKNSKSAQNSANTKSPWKRFAAIFYKSR